MPGGKRKRSLKNQSFVWIKDVQLKKRREERGFAEGSAQFSTAF